MRWVIPGPDRHYFEQHHHVVFTELLQPSDLSLLQEILLLPPKRDLSRSNPEVHKLVFRKDLAAIAADLLGKSSLRFAFDEAVKGPLVDIKSYFSIQGIVGGYALLPSGSVLFFDAEAVHLPIKEAFLIGYCEQPIYIHNSLDPQNMSLRDLGYSFGDKLKESTHPTIFRS